MKINTGSLSSSEANVTTGSDSRKRPFTLSAKNRMVVYERVWLGLPVKGGWGYWGTGQTGNER